MRERRVQQNLTQEALAALLERSPAQVSQWERGERLPGSESLPRICAALHCSADWLLGMTP